MRSASGSKFSLSAFGRRDKDKDHGQRVASESAAYNNNATGGGGYAPSSPVNHAGAGYNSDGTPSSPTGGPGATFDVLGRKLGKTIAHQSLLPGLGNKDIRALQDVISSEKGVLNVTEKLVLETQKAAGSLPLYGQQEGPDLQDILTHSSTLLNHLSTALQVFSVHQAGLRGTLKRIREREEALAELRNRRRSTGNKAENAERKLAKMGPENKGLPQQTELLERLRQEMRQMDTDIVMEESKLGDFKRQVVKEALSLKFGGLEELGEKMCIIGELGKLILEEIPLEETPAGYGRAPYTGYDKTENAVNEAVKCLATVQFHAASTTPKAPGLPSHVPPEPLHTPQLPRRESNIAAAEEFANYPGNLASPVGITHQVKAQDYSLDEDPYGGISNSNPYERRHPDENNVYREYGGMRAPSATGDGTGGGAGSQLVWQGPTDEALVHGQEAHGYEYEQQVEMEREQAERDAREQRELQRDEEAWRRDTSNGGAPLPNVGVRTEGATPISAGSPAVERPWEPLNVRRTPEPAANIAKDPVVLHDPVPSGRGVIPVYEPGTPIYEHPIPGSYDASSVHHTAPAPGPNSIDLPPPIPISTLHSEQNDDFHTPLETPSPLPVISTAAIDVPPPSPSHNSGGGKISAAAFRRGVKPRQSEDEHGAGANGAGGYAGSEAGSDGVPKVRRLPVPPVGSTGSARASPMPDEAQQGTFAEAQEDAAPPPSYGHEQESLR